MYEPHDSERTMQRLDGGLARFITFSCVQRLPLLGSSAIRDFVRNKLARCHQQHEFRLLAWILMPEHVHLLIVPGADGPTKLLISLKTTISMGVLARWKETEAPILAKLKRPDGSHRFWLTGGGFDRNIRTRKELIETIVYINQNPVKRGLVLRPIDWEWFSAAAYHGRDTRPPQLDLAPQSEVLADIRRIETLQWGYTPIDSEV